MDTLDDYLNLLYDGLTGYVYSPLISPVEKSINQQFFLWPNEKDSLKSWITSRSEIGNIYVSPVVYREQDAHKKFAKASNVVWVEYDGESLPNLSGLPKPDCIIQSSSVSHQHIYWRINNTSSLGEIEEVNRRLSRHIGADSGWAINKLLRPPGTKNHKYNNVNTCLITFSLNGRNDFGAFDSARDTKSVVDTKLIETIPESSDILSKHSLKLETIKMVMKDIPSGDRSGFLYKLGCTLSEEGLGLEDIVSLLLVADDRVGKFRDREDRLFQLTDIATKACAKVEESGSEKKIFNILTPIEVIKTKNKLKWYIDGWLHSRGGLILSSPPGVGKTQLSLQLAYALSTGTSFLGNAPFEKPLKVLFASLEMETMELSFIYERQQKVFKEKKELWIENFGTTDSEEELGTKEIDFILDQVKPNVIIIDSLSELAGDDLKEAEARRVMKWFRSARRLHNVAIVLIHHNRKGGDGNKKPRTLDDLYGSFWFGKAPDTVIGLWHDEGQPIEVKTLKHRFAPSMKIFIERDPDTFTFKVVEEPVDDSKSKEHKIINPRYGFS